MTFTIIIMLLGLIMVFNKQTANVSKSLLEPLRFLMDDMVALTSMRLIHIGARKDDASLSRRSSFQELSMLEQAFRTLRSAVRSWAYFVPPVVAVRLFTSGVEAKLGVTKATVSVLFCDISDFEVVCNELLPAEVLEVLSKV